MMIHPLLPELIKLQRKDRYLRPEAILELSQKLAVPVNKIYSVASFYHGFRFTPCGIHQIKVCVGAACYVKDAQCVFSAFSKYLDIREGDDTSPDSRFTLSKVACLGCCMMAVAVQIDQHIFGHVTPYDIPAVLEDFLRMDQEDYQEQPEFENGGNVQAEIRICRCSSCRAAGSGKVYKAFNDQKKAYEFVYFVKEVSCHGMSYRAPLVTVVSEGVSYHYDRVQLHHIRAIVAKHFIPNKTIHRAIWKGQVLIDKYYSKGHCSNCISEHTQHNNEIDSSRLITRNSTITHPESLEEYKTHGGMFAFQKSLTMPQETIIKLLIQSKLRGRGGGGFLTGEKWRLAHEASGHRKVVICNADEGDPGAFMDRMLMESYPYRVLEGILIASKFLRAISAIIYIREEYTQAIRVLENTINSLRSSKFFDMLTPDFDIILFKGAGAFICGEETALLESIEGNRGIPRKRPPFPVTCGLGGLPTLINNVETFACIPVILQDDGYAFNSIGTQTSHGTKAFALAGKIKNGGLIEVPIGITIADIVEKYGGGPEDNHELKAVMIGGPSGGCIPQKRFDLTVDYETLQQSGAMMGSGGLIVLDERDCLVDLTLYYLRFLRDESCGKCVPCREGIIRLCEILEQLTRKGEKDADLLKQIVSLSVHIQQGSLCSLGRTAPNMVLSAILEFKDEFEAHLQGHCPSGKCVELTEFHISSECIGCSKCAQVCAADAITCIPLEHSHINQEQCIKCGVCRTICPQHAIKNIHRETLKHNGVNTELKNLVSEVGSPKQTIEDGVIKVDGIQYPYVNGNTLLDYATDHGLSIPTLCYLKGKSEGAHCMVCAAWDATLSKFIPSCDQLVQNGHVYFTSTEKVREFRRQMLSLMLNRHDLKCGKCAGKGDCSFLDLLSEYRVKKLKSVHSYPEKVVADFIEFDSGKCILCQRCLSVSQQFLTIQNRGEKSCISPAPELWDSIPEVIAKELSQVCPTGALSIRNK